MATDVQVRTDWQFLDEMIQLIDGTHWTKEALYCPVYPKRKMRVSVPTNPSGYGFRVMDDMMALPIKMTACLVGLAMAVDGLIPIMAEDPREWIDFAADPNSEGSFESPASREQIRRICAKLTKTLRDTHDLRDLMADEVNLNYLKNWKGAFRGTVLLLESWNDSKEVERHHVRKLVLITRDGEDQPVE